ncbi:hypothetical protein RCL1_006381 [Eukaryota sp. TZLM3-RCL]
MLIDFHCHHTESSSEVIQIRSLFTSEATHLTNNHFYTIGIHPWHTSNLVNPDAELATLSSLIDTPSVLAVGECGFDRLKGAPLEIQRDLFIKQINIAKAANKPVVVHCVKCVDEVLEVRRLFPLTKFAIHMFSGTEDQLIRLIKADFYISFATSILRPKTRPALLLSKVPLDRIFLETDTAMVHMSDVYSAAAELLSMSVEQLSTQILSNCRDFFGERFTL